MVKTTKGSSGTDKKKKKKKQGKRFKVKSESALLYFIAHNPHPQQTKKLLETLLLPEQYTVLREIAINDLANNLPAYGALKKKQGLRTELKARFQRLAQGVLKKRNLRHVYPLLKLLAGDALTYHGLC